MKKAMMFVAMFGVMALVLGLAGIADATTYNWDDGGTGSNWSTGDNWDPNGVPGTDTSDVLDISVAQTVTVDQNVHISDAWMYWSPVPFYAGGTTLTANWNDDGAGRTVQIDNRMRVIQGAPTSSGTVSATLNVTDIHLSIGTLASPGAVIQIGRNSAPGVEGASTQGILKVTGGSVTAYVWQISLGVNRNANTGSGPTGSGALDLSACTQVMIDVDKVDGAGGHVLLGAYHDPYYGPHNQSIRNRGEFSVGGGSVTVSGNLVLADERDIDTSWGNRGKLNLTNTTFTVDGQALFYGRYDARGDWADNLAFVNTVVDGRLSGLDLTDTDSGALTFGHGPQNTLDRRVNHIDIVFADDPTETDADNWYWGLRWAGDHELVLEGYLTEVDILSRLTLDVSGLSDDVKQGHLNYLTLLDPGTYGSYTLDNLTLSDYITYDSTTGYTYVGVNAAQDAPIAEPAGLGLLGLALLGLRKRRS